MVVYAGLPPAVPLWQDERDKKNRLVHWLRANGFEEGNIGISSASEMSTICH